MEEADIKALSDDALIETFESVAIAHGRECAPDVRDPRIADLIDIGYEISERGEALVKRLYPFLDHANPWARYTAASACLDIDQPRCIAMLRAFTLDKNPLLALAALALMLHDPDFVEDLRNREMPKPPTDDRDSDS